MANLDLAHTVMKPASIVRYEIDQANIRTKQMLVGSVIAAMMIVVMAAMFLSAVN